MSLSQRDTDRLFKKRTSTSEKVALVKSVYQQGYDDGYAEACEGYQKVVADLLNDTLQKEAK